MKSFQNWFFQRVHGQKLIYNTCWEDPRCDRKLLQLQKDSKLVMITSAGNNALDYLLDEPAEIHAVDMNFRQNALLELKRSILLKGDYHLLFQWFGKGGFSGAKSCYYDQLRSNLPFYAQQFWDQHLAYFEGNGFRKSFYYRGASGLLAFFCCRYISLQKVIRQNVNALMDATSLPDQAAHYSIVENKIFNPFIRFLFNNPYTLSLAGVPQAQQKLIKEGYQGGTVEYLQACLRNVFLDLNIGDNYFYQVYFRGEYTPDCCPEYLKEKNFLLLRDRENQMVTHTDTLIGFLEKNPGTYSHFVLLDHQDWLAAHDVAALEKEWRLILKNSRPGTRILMRSATKEIDFFPEFIKDKIYFDQEFAQKIHQEDRVGTYASVYLGIVK